MYKKKKTQQLSEYILMTHTKRDSSWTIFSHMWPCSIVRMQYFKKWFKKEDKLTCM